MTFQTEAELLMRLRKEYKAEGYALVSGESVTAPDGSRAQPDLIARKRDHTVLIAFRPYGGAARDEERIRTLSDAAAANEDCSFRMFFVEGPELALPEPPEPREIAAQLERARALRDTGDGANALLAAWSALEAAARAALGREGTGARLQASSALIKDLIAHGYLGQDQLTRFHDLARKRDLAAHGYFHVPVDERDAEAVIGLAGSLLGDQASGLRVAAVSRPSSRRERSSRRSRPDR